MTSPLNRRLAALVSLLYVFFSTFGAVTHSHAASDSAGAPHTPHGSRQTAFISEASGSVPVHCPVCEWQSLQAAPPPASVQVVQPVLLGIEQTVVLFRLASLPAFRSSSRGPPLA